MVRAYVIYAQHNFDDDFVVIESLEDFDFWGGTIRHTEKNNTQKKRYSRTGAHKYRVCTR